MAASIFLKVKGAQVGPLTPDELQEWISKRKIRPEDLIWDEDSDEWIPLTESELVRDFLVHPDMYERVVLAVGSGKGGVGKTALVVSMGVALASMGKKVILVDADLGGANLHTFMGIQSPEYTFWDFYTNRMKKLSDILLPTSVENLWIISGACGTLGLANPRYSQKLRFIRQLRELKADYVIIDLGAGSSLNVIDFFLAAGDGIIVSTPEPASIQEAFFFLKQALMRRLQQTFRKHPRLASLFDLDTSVWNRPQVRSIRDLYKEVEELDPEAASIYRGIVQRFQPRLILNMVRHREEVAEGYSLRTAVGELLAIEMDFWGAIPFDEKVREAAMLQRPFMLHKPGSRAGKALSKIVMENILDLPRLRRFLDRKKLERILSRLEVREEQINKDPIICSVRCSYWDDCEYQNGGYPCGIRNLELILKD
jgi:flagellar biosynthesis protein FlhG